MIKLWNWIKGLFVKKEKDGEFDKQARIFNERDLSKTNRGNLSCQLISFSDASYTCSMAAKICVGKDVDEGYDERLAHISRVVGRGHESTIAQSNIVMLLTFSDTHSESFLELANAFKFLNFKTKTTAKLDTVVLIGGSIRAYKYFIREAMDINNPICTAIIDTLYIAAEKEFFEDFIKDGIMFKERFTFAPVAKTIMVGTEEEENQEAESTELIHQERTVGKYVDIIHSDDPYAILDKVYYYGFDIRDVLKVTSVTLLFHDFSRSTSQQITRHFAGISQESQRYVDYSSAPFVNPLQFNDKYDLDKKYDVELFGTKAQMTSDELGKELISVYDQLLKQGMLKQDARGFLIFNVATKVLMTFTFADLIHFIKERDDKAAQPEVRIMTQELEEQLAKHNESSFLFTSNTVKELINICETPRYKYAEEELRRLNELVDEVISEEEVVE